MTRSAGRVGLALAAVGALLVGCTTIVGTPQTPGDVAGLPVTHFDSGLKANAPKPTLDVQNATDGEDDVLAASALEDVEVYWRQVLPAAFGTELKPLRGVLSYDSRSDTEETPCGSVRKLVNAFYCTDGDIVAWDRGVLLPMLREKFGPMSVVTVLAHEFGHAVQYRVAEQTGVDKSTPTIVKEQQADCFAGGYYRWVAENRSNYFQVSTAEGLNQVLASLFFIRDEAGSSATARGAHGSAFDRTYAFQAGFEKGPRECAGMNAENIKSRITERPFAGNDESGDIDITEDNLKLLKQSLDGAFGQAGSPLPTLVLQGARCPNGRGTAPTSYCADDNTVAVDVDALAKLGRPIDRETDLNGDSGGLGDFAAFAEVASRYVLGVQKGLKIPLDNSNAGLRTACLVGAWAATGNQPGAPLTLSSGDLDEAIADLLQPKGLISADVNGNRPPNGFARVESLRRGYLEGSPVCSQRYS